MVLVLNLHVANGHENGYRCGGEKQVEEVDSEAVHQQRAHHAERARSIVGMHPELNLYHSRRGEHYSDESGDGVGPLHLGGEHEVNEQDAEGKQSEQGHGQS